MLHESSASNGLSSLPIIKQAKRHKLNQSDDHNNGRKRKRALSHAALLRSYDHRWFKQHLADRQYLTISSLSLSLSIHYYQSQELSLEERDDLFLLTRENMKQHYDHPASYGWCWSDKKKRSELLYRNARFLIAKMTSSDDIIAFVHFRYLWEASELVVYIYELQVRSDLHGNGIGQRLMAIMDEICRLCELPAIMLTALTVNHKAIKFYKEKCGFIPHPSSPSFLLIDRDKKDKKDRQKSQTELELIPRAHEILFKANPHYLLTER